MSARPALRRLADRVGILPAYVDHGGVIRRTADATRVALLAAMGVDASTEAAATQVLRRERAAAAAALVEPVRVAPEPVRSISVAIDDGAAVQGYELEVECEDGTVTRVAARAGRLGTTRRIRLPAPLPLGYHRVRLSLAMRDGSRRTAEQRLIVVPPRCQAAAGGLGPRGAYVLLANLYTVRSARNWGAGDLTDLRRLVAFAGRVGAAGVGINPLHALSNRGDGISPYSPVSRLYRNVLYLDVEAVPEWATLGAERRRLASPPCAAELVRLRAAERIDYAGVMALKRPLFESLHRRFVARHRDAGTARGRAYRRYLAAEGRALVDFATFCALQEHFEGLGRRGVHERSWRAWPAAYRDPRAPAVEEFRRRHAEAVDLHCFLQFELDRQLGRTAAAARAAGLPIGVYQDLALGSSGRGSDAWAYADHFLDGVTIGAPPDAYSALGQNWALPALDPRALARRGYEYWIRLVRAGLRHAGALRIDHVMGLFRQYWIPDGCTGAQGAYVRFPGADLLGILALESRRAGTLIIGEDLGTVPPGLSRQLARWGILSTRVLYFARRPSGAFLPAHAYPARALVAANTHDMVPVAGFWEGSDLPVRRQLGLIADDRALAEAEAERVRTRRALLRRLRADGVLPRGAPPSGVELRAAVHAFLGKTPAALVGVSLDDLVGETTPVNQPGVTIDRYPSWSRRLRLPLEALTGNAELAQALNGLPTSPRAISRKR